MRHILHAHLLALLLLAGGALLFFDTARVYANDATLENQVAQALIEESANGKIRAVIFDFVVSSDNTGTRSSEKESQDRGARFTEEFIAKVINAIKDSGKRDHVAIIDSSKLEEILREKNITPAGAAAKSPLEIGGIAGVDVIVSGRISVAAGKNLSATAKVVRVKDGEILSIAKHDQHEKQPDARPAPITLIDTVEKIEIGSWKAIPLSLTSGGTLGVSLSVVHGNAIDVSVVPGPELENFKNHREFKQAAEFMAAKTRSYERSAALGAGDYYLVLRDRSLGIFSKQNSEIRVTVHLK